MFWHKKRTYLDYAAGVSANASSPHTEGRAARQMLEDARLKIARTLEVQADDVIFTSGATEANALAILGTTKPGDHVLYLPSSHASIVENAAMLRTRKVSVEELPIQDGRVDCDKLAKLIRSNTVLVLMDAVCGETGVIWNTREVKQTIGTTILLHVDASQAPLSEKITRAHFAADLLALDASKVGNVRGIGALVAHRTIAITPFYAGGGQERGLRPGSEAPILAKQFADTLAAVVVHRDTFRTKSRAMRNTLVARIEREISNVHINEGPEQAPHVLNLSVPGRDTDYLVALLDEAGFAVSTRSACETDSLTGSRAVYVLTGDRARAMATLRLSWGRETSARDLERFAEALIQSVAFIDRHALG